MEILHILLILAQVLLTTLLCQKSHVHLASHLNMVSRIESKHMPAEIKFKRSNKFHDIVNKPILCKLQKYVWDQTKPQEYFAMYSSEDVSALFEHAANLMILILRPLFRNLMREFAGRVTACRKLL